MGRLNGKVAIVTGSAKGIGAATVRRFIEEGAQVLITDIDDESGIEFASHFPHNASYAHLDISNEKNWIDIFNLCNTKFGKVDILFNNAGIMGVTDGFGPQDPENTSLLSWKLVHAINLDGVFLGCKYAIKNMKKNGGSIINMSSRSGIVGVPTTAAYASSKAGIRNLTKSVALYCASKNYNIRCNSIHPAAIITDMWKHLLGNTESEKNSAIENISSGIPLKRMGIPIEVANVVVFLGSEESSFMTGSEIVIDGGILAGSSSSPKDK